MIEEITLKRKEFIKETLGVTIRQFGTGLFQEFGSIYSNPSVLVSKFDCEHVNICVCFTMLNNNTSTNYNIRLLSEHFEPYIKEILVPTMKVVNDLFNNNHFTELEQNKIIFEYNKKFEILNETTKIPIEIAIRHE